MRENCLQSRGIKFSARPVITKIMRYQIIAILLGRSVTRKVNQNSVFGLRRTNLCQIDRSVTRQRSDVGSCKSLEREHDVGLGSIFIKKRSRDYWFVPA